MSEDLAWRVHFEVDTIYVSFLFSKSRDVLLSFFHRGCILSWSLLRGVMWQPCSPRASDSLTFFVLRKATTFSFCCNASLALLFIILFSTLPNDFFLLFSDRLGGLKHLLTLNNSQNPHTYLQISKQTIVKGKRKEGQRTPSSLTFLRPGLILFYGYDGILTVTPREREAWEMRHPLLSE